MGPFLFHFKVSPLFTHTITNTPAFTLLHHFTHLPSLPFCFVSVTYNYYSCTLYYTHIFIYFINPSYLLYFFYIDYVCLRSTGTAVSTLHWYSSQRGLFTCLLLHLNQNIHTFQFTSSIYFINFTHYVCLRSTGTAVSTPHWYSSQCGLFTCLLLQFLRTYLSIYFIYLLYFFTYYVCLRSTGTAVRTPHWYSSQRGLCTCFRLLPCLATVVCFSVVLVLVVALQLSLLFLLFCGVLFSFVSHVQQDTYTCHTCPS